MVGSKTQATTKRGSRLVVVSNRVTPVTARKALAGGLAAGVLAALRDSGGIWFGWSGAVSERPASEPAAHSHDKITYLTTDLSPREFEEYYNGFSNRTLWPLFHYRLDLSVFDRVQYETYLRVNRHLASRLLPYLESDDLIWVHDYHLIPFAEELRKMGVGAPIGFFLHTPLPPADLLVALPRHDKLLRSLFAYDLVGFQTDNDVRNFRDYIQREANGRLGEDGLCTAFGRTIRVGAFPIGIDAEDFAALADTPEAVRQRRILEKSVVARDVIIGVDRTDYSKGLPSRLKAFELLLENYPVNRGRVHLLQITPPSREHVPEYGEILAEIEGLSGHINGRFAEFDWVPIRFIHKAYNRRILSGFFRASRVGLVTPLRDGMNMVAKEYVAAQDPDDPGVLVLSRFAGAARQMDRALIVNPYDLSQVADAIQEALEMPLDERRSRWRAMMDDLKRNDIERWRASFVEALQSASAELDRPEETAAE
ncbi:MAG TPA: alpha,alpha-trehalose-phosphate synthase (UDP-forming) [Alphaproteobacteria bacterium]